MSLNKREEVLEQIREVPEDFMEEILEFINYLMFRKHKMDTALASESVLARDWLNPEEEEAWKDL